jgi:hypothetical protein
MKTLVRDGRSIFLFEDDEHLDIQSDKIVVGDPERLIIGDCNSSNVTLFEDVAPPEDWFGHRYLFDGTDWTVSPDWPADKFEWDGTRWKFID